MAGKPKRIGTEWVGGLVSMPAYVTGEGEPYRPEALFWLTAEGTILGTTMGKPGEVLPSAATSLREAVERPICGPPHAPDRVRVGSPELALALRDGRCGLEVICAPTPEIDAMLAAMRERMGEDAETEQSYLSPGLGPEAVASFFRATAALFRAKPWKVVPSDESILAVTIEKLGVREAALSVIGQMGQSFGLILFSGRDAFEAFRDAADAIEHGEAPAIPPHLALNFERGAEMTAALRKEVSEHRWEVAAADAYPWLVAVDSDLVARPPTAEEATIAEAIALALPEVLGAKKVLAAAWSGGEPVARTLSVPTHAGEFQISLRAPYEQRAAKRELPYDVLADLHDLGRDDAEVDAGARRELEDELVARFVTSPEAKSLSDIQCCHFIMDFAADYFGATIATLGPRELREIVFEIIPRKMSIEASFAGWIIEESRAFYAFLKREFGLRQADACLGVLGGDAVAKLEAALSDSSNFGMAKSLFMAGRKAGFDMESEEGIAAWMRVAQSQPLPASVRLPSIGAVLRPAEKAAARAKKNRRKAARKARKKNR